MKSARVGVPNAVILIMGHASGQVPESMGGQLVAASRSCVAVGTLGEPDGMVDITLADDAALTGGHLVFDGVVETPGLTIAVCSVLDEKILETPVVGRRTRVRVLVNDLREPNDVRVHVSSE